MKLECICYGHLRSCAELYVGVFNAEPWNENWGLESVLERLEQAHATPGFFGMLARDGGLLGFALGCIESWHDSRHFMLKEMCVAPEHQRTGLGTRILAALEEELEHAGVEKLYLLTARGGGAEAFYRKNGFYLSPKMVMLGKYLGADREPKGRVNPGAKSSS